MKATSSRAAKKRGRKGIAAPVKGKILAVRTEPRAWCQERPRLLVSLSRRESIQGDDDEDAQRSEHRHRYRRARRRRAKKKAQGPALRASAPHAALADGYHEPVISRGTRRKSISPCSWTTTAATSCRGARAAADQRVRDGNSALWASSASESLRRCSPTRAASTSAGAEKATSGNFLIKQGIQHVVSRAHHPETVGKCERFWETVKTEFWERVEPQELTEARERISQFIEHYNHFRPHQGLDGMTPADRFFGAEAEVRKALEDTISKNALESRWERRHVSPSFSSARSGISSSRCTAKKESSCFRLPTADQPDRLRGLWPCVKPEPTATQPQRRRRR